MPSHAGRSHPATLKGAHWAAIMSVASLLHSEYRVKQMPTHTALYTAAITTSTIAETPAGDLQSSTLICSVRTKQSLAVLSARIRVGFAEVIRLFPL